MAEQRAAAWTAFEKDGNVLLALEAERTKALNTGKEQEALDIQAKMASPLKTTATRTRELIQAREDAHLQIGDAEDIGTERVEFVEKVSPFILAYFLKRDTEHVETFKNLALEIGIELDDSEVTTVIFLEGPSGRGWRNDIPLLRNIPGSWGKGLSKQGARLFAGIMFRAAQIRVTRIQTVVGVNNMNSEDEGYHSDDNHVTLVVTPGSVDTDETAASGSQGSDDNHETAASGSQVIEGGGYTVTNVNDTETAASGIQVLASSAANSSNASNTAVTNVNDIKVVTSQDIVDAYVSALSTQKSYNSNDSNGSTWTEANPQAAAAA